MGKNEELQKELFDKVNELQQLIESNERDGRRIRGWVNFDGTQATSFDKIKDSYNVSSVTDNGVGDHIITWDEAFADANYCVVANARVDIGVFVAVVGIAAIAAGNVEINVVASSDQSAQDSTYVMVMATGDR